MDGGDARFIELAGQINDAMPRFVMNKVQMALNDAGNSIKGARIQLLGVAYKRDVDDLRESPALDVLELLLELGAELSYSDSHVPRVSVKWLELDTQPELPRCRKADCAVLTTDHSAFEYAAIVNESRLIVDTRNAFRGFRGTKIIPL